MAKCDVCGKDKQCRLIAGLDICENCFSDLQMIRNGDSDIIAEYLDDQKLVNASEAGKKYMQKTIASYSEYRFEDKTEDATSNKESSGKQSGGSAVGVLIKVLSVILFIVVGIYSFQLMERGSFIWGIICLFAYALISALVFGIGEIICLLKKIYEKLEMHG